MSDEPFSATASRENLPKDADVRLVVADMDGTLLDDSGAVPGRFWPLLDMMAERGIVFAPASGRQVATLTRLFERALAGMALIAENGSFVVRDGAEISSSTIERETVVGVVDAVRAAGTTGHDVGVVICGKRSAYVERADQPFIDECHKYYVKLDIVDDVLRAQDEVVKLSVFVFGEAEESAPLFDGFRDGHQVVVSGHQWIDIMREGVNKGVAVKALQSELDVTPAQTVAFGDYFNDAEMLDQAELSFAMANAHPQVQARARYLAPSSSEAGVVTALEYLLQA